MPSLLYSPTEVGVQPAMTPADAQGANFTPAVGQQLEHLGTEGARIASDLNRIQYQQKEADATAWVSKTVSDQYVNWKQYSEAAKAKAAPNGEGYTPQLLDAFDKQADATLANAPTVRSKRMLAEQMGHLRTNLAGEAITWEAGQRRAYRMDQVDQSIDQNASLIQQDPKLYDQLVQNQLQSVNDISGELHPEDKLRLNQQVRKQFAEAASLGFVNSNPATAHAILSGEHPLPPDSVQGKIVAEARNKGVDPSVALANAYLEGSHFDPSAKNPSPGETSAGLFGQTDTSWAQYAGKGADRGDVDTQIKSGIAQIADNQRILKKQLGRDPTPYEMRFAHWFGPGTVSTVNESSDATPFAQVLTKSGYSAKTVGTVLAHNGLNASTTLGDVKHVVQMNMDKALQQTQGYANAPDAKDGPSTDDMPAFLAQLTPQGRQAMLTHAQTLMRKDDTLERTQVESKFNDASAAWERGESAKDPPSLAEWQHAFGPQMGLMKYQKQVEVQNFGAKYAQVATATPAQQAEIYASTAGASDALGMQGHDLLGQAIYKVNQERAADPIGFDQVKGMKMSKPIDWSNPQFLSSQLNARYAQAEQVSNQFGTPYQPLSKDEAGKLSQFFDKAEPGAVQQYLSSMRAAAGNKPEQYHALLSQVAPNHPALAVAGMIGDQNPSAAAMVIQGAKMLHPVGEKKESTILLPREEMLRQAWHDNGADEAYGYHQASGDYAFQAAKAYYVAAQPPKDRNDKTIDPVLWQKAMDSVTGGVVEFGPKGSKVLPPYGMPAANFHDSVAQVWPSVMRSNGLDPDKLPMDQYSLTSIGPSQYAVTVGNGFLPNAKGEPVTFDLLNPVSPQQNAITPDMMQPRKPAQIQADNLRKLPLARAKL